jgi:hypothetical protein
MDASHDQAGIDDLLDCWPSSPNHRGFGRMLTLQAQSGPVHRLGVLPALQRVACGVTGVDGEPLTWRITTLSRKGEMAMPTRSRTARCSRGRVQYGRWANGSASSSSVTTRTARLFHDTMPGLARVRSAAIRRRRTAAAIAATCRRARPAVRRPQPNRSPPADLASDNRSGDRERDQTVPVDRLVAALDDRVQRAQDSVVE